VRTATVALSLSIAVLALGCGNPKAAVPQPGGPGGHPDLTTLQSMLPSLKLGLSAQRVHELMGLPDDSPAGQERYLSSSTVGGQPIGLTLTYNGDQLQSFVLGPMTQATVAPVAPVAPAPAASPAS
jgi:hypothetical protein